MSWAFGTPVASPAEWPHADWRGGGLVAYSPLGRGFLTGAFSKPEDIPADDYRRRFAPRFQGDNFTRNLALAWVMAQGDDIIPIPGTKRRTYLDQNIAALDVELSAAERVELDQAFPPDVAADMRYPESFIDSVNA